MDRLEVRLVISLVMLVMAGVFCLLSGPQNLFAGTNKSGALSKKPEALVLLPMNMNAVVVEKKSQQVFLFSSNGEGVYERLRFPCSTGASPGVKLKSGDQKTPEGIYFFTDEYEDRYLSPVYGKKAFPTDYPNFIDRKKGKNGSAIWLHGTNKKLKPMDSNGCVAMNNNDILRLSEYISPGATPVVMVDTISYAEPASIDGEKNALLTLVSNWKSAIESGTYQEYLSLYDSGYLPDIEWWKNWLALRNSVSPKGLEFKISIDPPGIYKEKGVFVIFFNMEMELGNSRKTLGKRKLFVEKKGDNYKITGDLFQRFPKGEIGAIGLVAQVAKDLYLDLSREPSLQETVDGWLVAWSTKDMKTYADFYSSRFFSDGMNKEKWVERKVRLAKRYASIKVVGRNFKINKGETKSVVTFVQDYRTGNFKEKGFKRLVLLKEEGVWRIYRESWKKS